MVCWTFSNEKKTMNSKRVKNLNEGIDSHGSIVYWMNRDQRVKDNYALLYSQKLAKENKTQLEVFFHFPQNNPNLNRYQLNFLILGLKEIEKDLKKLKISFSVLIGNDELVIPQFLDEVDAGQLITDFSPLREDRIRVKKVLNKINFAFYQVDTHNIVPVWEASNKQEYAARTIRPKINKLLPAYLVEPRQLEIHPIPPVKTQMPIHWNELINKIGIDISNTKKTEFLPGEQAGLDQLRFFIDHHLTKYNSKRNNPNCNYQSNLSPYLHFGQLSALRVALSILESNIEEEKQEAFLEQLIIRRELADNFCCYNEKYDDFEGFPAWAKKSLDAHREDEREYIYTLEMLEEANTHDPLWNAAQQEMKFNGKMHGYMRMYWAKKILEWSFSPELALKYAIALNNKYEIDGNDPNGYTGIAWSIGGVHDRPWFERPVFGLVRYMSYNGCKSKFAINDYINKNSCISESNGSVKN